jgi:OST3 / OST6 family, transporter family
VACSAFDKELSLVARTIAKGNIRDGSGTPIYFARADYLSSKSVFSKYSLKGVPHLVHFGPTGAMEEHSDTKFPPQNPMPLTTEVDAEAVANWVRDKTGASVKIERPMWPRVLVAVTTISVLTLLAWQLGPRVWELFVALREWTVVWGLGCLFVYFISVSGFLYDIIRGVPMMGASGGRPELIAKQNGTQYVAEGMFIGILNVLAGSSIVALVVFGQQWTSSLQALAAATAADAAAADATVGASKRAKDAKDAKDAKEHAPRITEASLILASVAIFLFFISYTWIVTIYKYKSGWYRPLGFLGM